MAGADAIHGIYTLYNVHMVYGTNIIAAASAMAGSFFTCRDSDYLQSHIRTRCSG